MYRDKPFIQCEYAHAMGNSLGNFADYWREFKKYDRLCGGYIWDFADQSIKRVQADGTVEWTYGGDWGDQPNDGTFAFNGIVRADRSPNPALYEVKKVYQQIQFALEGGRIAVTNEYMFRDLSAYSLRVELVEDGISKEIKEIAMPDVKPGEKGYADMPFAIAADKDVAVNVYAVQKADERGIEAGHIVAEEQIAVGAFKQEEVQAAEGKTVSKEGEDVVIDGGAVVARVNGDTGYIDSIRIRGKEVLAAPVKPNFWRAPIDNDLSPQIPPIAQAVFGKFAFKKAQERIVKSNYTLTERASK